MRTPVPGPITPPGGDGMSESQSIAATFLERVFGSAPVATSLPQVASQAASASSPFPSAFPSSPFNDFGPAPTSGLPSEASAFASRSASDSIPAPVVAAMAANSSGAEMPASAIQQAVSRLRDLADQSFRQKTASFGGSQVAAPQSKHVGDGARSVLRSTHTAPPGESLHGDRSRPFDISSVRADFPALHQSIHGFSLVWFDNAATTHKPLQVIEAMSSFYAHDYSNIHRAAHALAARATDHYEAARQTVAETIRASSSDDIVFVRGTTEGINLIANITKGFLREGDEILLSEFEHHANIVPWQMVAREVRARIRVVPFDNSGEVLMEEYRRLLGPRTRLVSLTHASNTLGTVLPVEEMTRLAHQHGARVVIDGAQSIAHMPVDVQAIGCDFFVFSGHKVFAPTGIGVVYVHPDLHEMLPPWQGGGNMIRRVAFDETTYADAPAKFEAGTPSIGDAVGLGSALRYLRQFDPVSVEAHEHALLEHATRELKSIRGVTIYGNASHKVGLVSFTLDGYTTEMVGRELDRVGIAVRTGHHCAQPSLRHFGLEATIRPSFALYNTHDEVERMIEVILRLSRKR
ncbi:MAG: cysteine desulfurase [Pirellula sp.]|nr:cysteine desulfurase [Pirellula sp.]